MTTTDQTAYQRLRTFNEATGLNVTLRPFESIGKMTVTPDASAIVIDGLHYRETEREYRVTGSYKRMIMLAVGRYEMMALDADGFKPYVIKKFDFFTTPRDQVAKRDWERMCHRPGDGSRFGERDSYERQNQGSSTYIGRSR